MPETKPCILVVDDEAPSRRLLRRCFEYEGYLVEEAACSTEALKALGSVHVDLITLDILLDGEDGLKLASEIRARSTVPIIMVSGKGDLIDKVVGLEVGADDYIAKPFEIREVIARVKSALRRSQLNLKREPFTAASANERSALTSQDTRIQFSNYVICPNARDLVLSDGSSCRLTTAEFSLLYTLAVNSHRVLTRDQIMDAMHGKNWNPTDRTIDNQVARLRKKLLSCGVPECIKTVRGYGYKFTQPVSECKPADPVVSV